MLIDDVTIKVNAGKGGKGGVYFNKNLMSLGPTGGRGGNGGSIYMIGVSDLGALKQFRYKKEIVADDGEDGKKQLNDGAAGHDIILQVPVGTVVHNLDTGKDQEVTKIGEKVLVAEGGFGGHGNYHFRSGRNTSPRQFQPGLPGEAFALRLELKLIADVGFIGFPNAGKSSLLNELTAAKSKVANYPFTTLEPNLGVYYDLILADIPGLIEGASTGKGLGIKFLRHVERTKILFHLISAESEDPLKDYYAVIKELMTYSDELIKKPEYIFLAKSDLLDEKALKEKLIDLKKAGKPVKAISIYDSASLEEVKKILNKLMEEKKR
ncbi:GTPase ObgE [Candidatus Parcubacteria bacterium]|nr:MAG: GTPase ObgE [Candidatus Parcubacteria bacterium]